MYYTNTEYLQVGQINGMTVTGVTYSVADDKQFHYHMYNSYEEFITSTTVASLDADGAMLSQGLYDYAGFDANATSAATMTFTGTSTNSFVGISCQKGSPVNISNPFDGLIYEILIYKNDVVGGYYLPDDGINDSTAGITPATDILEYLHRKYQSKKFKG